MTEASLGLGDWSGSRGRENGGVRERLQWSHGFPFEKWESTREPGLVNFCLSGYLSKALDVGVVVILRFLQVSRTADAGVHCWSVLSSQTE